MIKLTGKLWFLALCLGLVVGIVLASSSKTEAVNEIYETAQTVEINGTNETNETGKTVEINETNSTNETGKTVEINGSPLSQSTSSSDSPSNSSPGIFYTVITIVLILLIALCLVLIYYLNKRWNETIKKIAPSKRRGTAELNTDQPPGNDLHLEKRLSELEKVVADLKEIVNYLLVELNTLKKESNEEQQPQESSRWRFLRGDEIPAHNQKILTESTTRQDHLFNKDIFTSDIGNKSGLISRANMGLRLPPEIQKITVAFNKMMFDSTRLDEGSMDLFRLRNDFIKNYNVVAFKCANSQERVNHPERQPQFERCQASESTLWRIQLSDGTFAVLPGLREYESTVHFQGGMKELFKSDYKSGAYRKIELLSPAIVKSDFSINKQGELRLNQ